MIFDIFLWFWTFSPKWITFDTCSRVLTPRNTEGLLWLTFDKNQSKKIFLKKIVEKIFIVRSQQIFSPELKALARFCKNQLRHQWIATDRPLWKWVRNFNFFITIVIKFLNFDLNFGKFFEKISKFKTRKILKFNFFSWKLFSLPLVVKKGQPLVLTKFW